MCRGGIEKYKRAYLSFGFLLLTVCPLLFPKIGEQQYSYVLGLCFLGLAWMALTYRMQKCRQAMLVRSMDMAIAVCLLALLLHIFWIRPVSLSVWRWVDAAGLFAFYVFVRLSSSKEIKILLAYVMVGGLFQCLYAGMQGMGWLPSLHNAFPMTGSYPQAEADYKFLRNLSPTALEPVLKLARLYRDTGRTSEAITILKPYQKVSPKGRTLEQKAVLLEIRELYRAVSLKKP